MIKVLLSSLVILVIVITGGYLLYRHGYKVGFQDVQVEWRQQEGKLIAQVAELEARHAKQIKDIADEAERTRKEHEANVTGQRTVLEQRLSQSNRRAQVYRTQADACGTSSRDLAAHAASLDRSLEEGRGLVLELRSHLGFCENRVRLLGDVIKSDRQLAMEKM